MTAGGVKADPKKIAAMVEWPLPQTVKQLRGFLGLTGYYRRFIQGYASIAAPLTYLLCKDAFYWSPAASDAFMTLKNAIVAAPVLHLPDFELEFVLETDASNIRIGAVLMQQGHPISYFSQTLGPRLCVASTYIKELHAIVAAVQKWGQYLLGQFFIIRTNHISIKELFQQVIQTPEQQAYVRKLLGFHFRIEYKTRSSNKVTDALSRVHADQFSDFINSQAELFSIISKPTIDILTTLHEENSSLPDLLLLHNKFAVGELSSAFCS